VLERLKFPLHEKDGLLLSLFFSWLSSSPRLIFYILNFSFLDVLKLQCQNIPVRGLHCLYLLFNKYS
jgi:hypothetical protein